MFNKGKYPFYNYRTPENLTVANVLTQEGLEVFLYSPNLDFTKTLTPWDEIKPEDLEIFLEKCPDYEETVGVEEKSKF